MASPLKVKEFAENNEGLHYLRGDTLSNGVEIGTKIAVFIGPKRRVFDLSYIREDGMVAALMQMAFREGFEEGQHTKAAETQAAFEQFISTFKR